ncbi:MAG: 3-oxoadipate enol-lactonase [Xanthobacteraceae bacterium]|nr:MAG: 3-oxoadipate enol-lactonase [Xanthobacteraceae bacterium]
MPMIDADGCMIHVTVEGHDGGPTLMLSNSLGATLQAWEPQMAALTRQFRVVRYDRRGHGKSDVPPGPYSIGRLGRDALAVMDQLNLSRVHFCGMSMGGMIGQWLGAHAPERIDRLILSNTASYFPDPAVWNERIDAVREGRLGEIADRIMLNWFTADFRAREPALVARVRDMVASTPPQGYIGCCEAIRDMDHRDLLAQIIPPTLVIAGRHDPSTPLETAEFMRKHIPQASLTIIDAAHLSNIEQPYAFTEIVTGFLTQR